ncbi:MAG: hypothetical protein RR415_14495, partial [Ruthenibacterium sp.]
MQDKKENDTLLNNKNRNSKIRALQSRFYVTLTKPEGEMLDKIISDNGCANLSQLCKKIVKGEVS